MTPPPPSRRAPARPRVLLVHWNAAEAAERAGRLRGWGYDAAVFVDPRAGKALRAVRADPPAAFVVDLSRIPSQGRAVAVWLRQQKATRGRPLVLVGGEAAQVAAARALLPDAAFATWRGLASALRRALSRRRSLAFASPAGPAVPAVPDTTPVVTPLVPDTMAGYSGTPLWRKLGIRAGGTLRLRQPPDSFEATLGPLPKGARLVGRGPADVAILFCRNAAALARVWPRATSEVPAGGRLWICWPKKASGIATDLAEGGVRAFALARGFVDYKVCAVDSTWSGLCFARRA